MRFTVTISATKDYEVEASTPTLAYAKVWVEHLKTRFNTEDYEVIVDDAD
jgi:hypothetical protein